MASLVTEQKYKSNKLKFRWSDRLLTDQKFSQNQKERQHKWMLLWAPDSTGKLCAQLKKILPGPLLRFHLHLSHLTWLTPTHIWDLHLRWFYFIPFIADCRQLLSLMLGSDFTISTSLYPNPTDAGCRLESGMKMGVGPDNPSFYPVWCVIVDDTMSRQRESNMLQFFFAQL